MNRIARITILTFVVSLLVGLAAPAFATEAPDETTTATEATTETTVTATAESAENAPAVVIPPSSADEYVQPWTARFVYPLLGALTVLIVGGYAISYNRKIRKRYTVVA